jgi:hypothetical protein
MWYASQTTFKIVVDKHTPLRTVKASKLPWITSPLKDKMHKKSNQFVLRIHKIDFLLGKCVILLTMQSFMQKKSISKSISVKTKTTLKRQFPPWPGKFFKLARCGYTLRVTSQASSTKLTVVK